MGYESRLRFFKQNLRILGWKLAPKALDLVMREMCIEKDFVRQGDKSHYYHHCVQVAQKILNAGFVDENTICAALLHDIIEDVPGFTYETIALMFNEEVARIVDLVTKKPGIDYKKPENLAIYLDAIKLNLKAAMVKTADRMHNFSTLAGCKAEKKIKQVIETEEFFFRFFKECRKLYPEQETFFHDAKTIIEPHLMEIKDHYNEVRELEKQIEELKAELNMYREYSNAQ